VDTELIIFFPFSPMVDLSSFTLLLNRNKDSREPEPKHKRRIK
jgi:hypothetical protein